MMRKLRDGSLSDAAEAIYRTMILPIITHCGNLSLELPDSKKEKVRRIENTGKNVTSSTHGKSVEM